MDNLSCKYCNEDKKNSRSLINHELRCKKNPDRLKAIWSKEQRAKHSVLMKKKHNNTNRVWNKETLKIMSKKSKRINNTYWTEERKNEHSKKMLETVKKYPNSYSSDNVSGRAKIIEYNNKKLKGKWELLVAKWLDKHGYKWENDLEPFEYSWNNTTHLYFPDFYIKDLDVYIEVKGYERERDRCKWSVVKNLIIIKKAEINKIKNNTFDILREY